MRKYIYETANYGVYIGNNTDSKLPVERQRCYFVTHKEHDVIAVASPIYGEAVMMAEALEAATELVLADPRKPVAMPGSSGLGGLN